jgi:hypothetical protein
MPDPIQSLLRLQRKSADEARQTLAFCLMRERDAEQSVTAARAAIEREMAAAQGSDNDTDVEAFARWLPRGQEALATAEAMHVEAANATARARAALTLARGAAEATENLLEQRWKARRDAADRKMQAELDSAGLRAHQSDAQQTEQQTEP